MRSTSEKSTNAMGERTIQTRWTLVLWRAIKFFPPLSPFFFRVCSFLTSNCAWSSILESRHCMGQHFAKNKGDMGACVGKSGALSASKSKSKKHTFYSIGDQFNTLDEVQAALRTAGLESSNLIIGIDFTKSNTWTGERSFGGRCLHDTTAGVNPYQSVISIIGSSRKALELLSFYTP